MKNLSTVPRLEEAIADVLSGAVPFPAPWRKCTMQADSSSSFVFEGYRYQPLPLPTSIRLLSVLEDESGPGVPSIYGKPLLRCDLKTVDLDDKPQYDSLSYTWGNPFPEHASPPTEGYTRLDKWPIAVNGRLVYVMRNLYEALHQLRPTFETSNIERTFPPYNKTALLRHAEEGRSEDVKRLLRAGADLKARDMFGETALHYAAENGHLDIVKALVAAGSDISLRDSSKRQPVDCARQQHRRQWVDVVNFLTKTPTDLDTSLLLNEPLRSRYLWVDAICVDQKNIPERNAQVAIMDRIYAAAEKVVVWLGVADEQTSLAHLTMEGINAAPLGKDGLTRDHWYDSAIRYGQSKQQADLDLDWTSDGSIVSIRQLRALLNLLHRAWFNRAWCIQELVWAKGIELRCGNITFDWMQFFELVQHRLGKEMYQTPLSEPQAPKIKFNRAAKGTEAWSVTELRMRINTNVIERNHLNHITDDLKVEINQSWYSGLSLPVLLAMTWQFKASDPRDKVFALLSMARPVDQSRQIVADYAASVQDVYTAAARLFVEGTGHDHLQSWLDGTVEGFEPLEGLSFVQGTLPASAPRTPGLPSWVPDFSAPLVTPRLFRTRFNAATSLQHTSAPSFTPKLLALHLLDFDEIAHVERRPPDVPVGKGITYSVPSWLETISKFDATYLTNEPRLEALWRTLMIDEIWTNADGEADARASFRDFLCSDLTRAGAHPPYQARVTHLIATLRDADPTHALPTPEDVEAFRAHHDHSKPHICRPDAPAHGHKRNFHSVFCQHYRTRCLFRTRKGYLGLGPREAKEGDRVGLVAGARTPFVLRRRDADTKGGAERYGLVGEAYVHGIMRGEAAEGHEKEFRPIVLE